MGAKPVGGPRRDGTYFPLFPCTVPSEWKEGKLALVEGPKP